MQNFNKIGTIGLLALVALRLGIGWHFFKEGSEKIKSGTFSSDGFLKGANGRFAGFYHGLVWDYDGSIRLDSKTMLPRFDTAVGTTTKHFALSDEQVKELESTVKLLKQRLEETYKTHNEPIVKLLQGESRVSKMDNSAMWNEVASLRGQKDSIEKDRLTAVVPALKEVDALWEDLKFECNNVATPEQFKSKGRLYLSRPNESSVSSSTVDRIIPVFDFTVGVLLILGLCVPVASWAAALFLISVILSQFPGDPGTQPTYLYAVEALALIALASVGAGRFAGLDFFIWNWRQRKLTQTKSPATSSK